MPKYSEIKDENQGFSRVFMKEIAMCYDGGNGGEVQAGSIKITVRLFRQLFEKTVGDHSKTNPPKHSTLSWVAQHHLRSSYLLTFEPFGFSGLLK